MNICILGETYSFDIKSYQVLVRRIFTEVLGYKKEVNFFPFINERSGSAPFEFNGKGELLDLLPWAIEVVSEKYKLDLLVVIVDSDSHKVTEINKIKGQILEIIKSQKNHPEQQTTIGIAVRNIEAWLLSDVHKLRELSSQKKFNQNVMAEQISDPKGDLKSLWRSSDFQETYAEFAIKICEESDLSVFKKKSKYFSLFVEDLKKKLRGIKKES